ncbi:MAG TPA: signal peptidase I, partial [Egibacteraceae bacterium]|nr:signal peptidase I [Egibacteraceae bacterium]
MRHRSAAAFAIGGVALRALLVVSLGLLVALGVGPRSGRYRTLTVLSGSMAPAIPAGSVVVVTPQPLEELRVGQVLTYHIPVDDHRVVTHRVVEILEAGPQPLVRTRGDTNAVADPWLARISGEPAWTARLVVPHLGHLVTWLRQPPVRALGVWVAPILLAASWLGAIWRRPAGAALPQPAPGTP